MSKHTPGPWDVRKIDSAVSFRGIFGICANGGGGSIADEEKANAHLIAMAPEMLTLLKRLMAGKPGSEYQLHELPSETEISEIIAKAEGR